MSNPVIPQGPPSSGSGLNAAVVLRRVMLDRTVETSLEPWLKPQALIMQHACVSGIPHINVMQSPALIKRTEARRITPIVCDNRILFLNASR